MNRRGFLARMLGAAALAVAERVLPVACEKPRVVTEPEMASAWLMSWCEDIVYRVAPPEASYVDFGESPSVRVLEDIEHVKRMVREALLDANWS